MNIFKELDNNAEKKAGKDECLAESLRITGKNNPIIVTHIFKSLKFLILNLYLFWIIFRYGT